MKIDSALQHVSSIQNKAKAKPAKGRAAPAATGSVSDNVEITDTSSRMRDLETQLADIPIENSGKVDSIRQAIADGTFAVDEEVVAENMVQETIEQLSHRNSR